MFVSSFDPKGKSILLGYNLYLYYAFTKRRFCLPWKVLDVAVFSKNRLQDADNEVLNSRGLSVNESVRSVVHKIQGATKVSVLFLNVK